MKWPPSLRKLATLQFEHREAILWLGSFFLALFIFSQLFVFPAIRRSARLKKEIVFIKGRLEKFSSQRGSVGEAVISLQKELLEMEEGLVQKERASEILTSFLKKANELDIEVISVRPAAVGLHPSAEEPLRLEGKVCQALPFEMHLRCSYHDLGSYLELLEKDATITFTVDGLEIHREEGTSSRLRATLLLTTYFFGNPVDAQLK